MRAHFSSYHYPQWLRLMAAILVALVGLTLVNVTMAQSDASHTSDQPTSPQIIKSEAETVELTTEFAATGGIAGFVTAPDGRPLPRIEVMAYQQQPKGWEVVQSAVTDPSGHYLIPSLETGIYRLHFLDPEGHYAPEFSGHAMSVDEAADIPVSGELVPDINIVLFPTKSTRGLETASAQLETVQLPSASSGISGTVTASDGTALSGIEVVAYKQQPSGDWNEVRSVTTNASGTYLFALETAIYRLRFRDPSGTYAFEYYEDALTLDQATNIPVIGDIVPDIDAVLSSAGHITGTLNMFDGMPPNYAYVYLYHHNGFDWEYLYSSYLGSNPTSYDLGGLASGVYRLRVQGRYRNEWYNEYYNNTDNLSSATDITVTTGITTSNINVVLGDGGGRIAGTVTSSAGTPLEGIEATAYISQTTRWNKVGSITTNMSGTYHLPELADGIYAVRFREPAGTYALEYYSDALTLKNATPISVTAGTVTTGINAVLSSAGQITGTLSMFDDMPPNYAYVYLYHHNGFDWEYLYSSYLGSNPTSYDLGGLASGVYRLRVQGRYRNEWYNEYYNNTDNLSSATDITVTTGITTSNINVVLGDGGGRIAGTVTSPAGAPLEGIEATAYISQSNSWNKVGSITTNMSGTYQLPELDDGIYAVRFREPAGTYALEYYSDALTLKNATPISVTAGTVTTGINAVLSSAGQITGTLNMFDDMPPKYAYVYLYHHNGFDWEYLYSSYLGSNPTSYDLGGLATGVYRLRVQGRYHNDWYNEYYHNAINLSSATDIAVTTGITTPDIDVILGDVIYNGRITGTVTANAVPQEGILIDLYQDYTGNGDWWRLVYAHTDADGNYSIGALKDGLYRVRFSDEDGAYATVYYDGKADLPSANTITITNQTTVPDINASLTGAGSITGTVTLSGGGAGEGISVVAYRNNGSTWEALGTAISDQNGEYSIGRLLLGDYRLYFQDSTLTYRTEYYNDAHSITNANDVAVAIDTVTPNINVVLDLPAQPLADVSMFGNSGSVVSDPWTGEVTITFRRGTQLNTTIRTDVSCSDGSTPTNVTLWMNSSSYSMNESPPGSGVYFVTIPASDITNATLTVRWQCNGTSQQQTIGEIVLYDPSGYITDAATGLPVEGATVTLYRVPNWLPDTNTDMLNCRTVNTRSGADWSGEPDASIDLGVVVNPEMGQINSSPEISPTINPQITDPEGYYGWDVVQGCWYVAVQAAGYESRVSPVVGVPPEVTDLDLELTPLPPVADFTVSAQSGAAPLTVVFSDISTGTVTDWLWNFGDGGSSEQVTVTHTYTEAGIYSVALMVANPSGSDAITKSNYITVIDPPPANSVMLALSPQTVTTGLGKMVMLTIEVQAGTQEVDGAAAHLNFDPQYMRVLNVLPGNQLSTIILNQFDNDSGQLDFAAGSFNNFPSGSFTLATVFFQTTALTDEDGTPVEFNATLPRLSDVTFNSTSVLSATIDSTIFVEKSVILALEPPTLTTSVGQTFDLPILVEADSQAVEVASAYLNFDPTLMQVASITPGSELSNLLTNSFDNTGGQLDFVADAQEAPFPPFGTFTLATVTFTATNATTGTLVSFNTTAARNSDTTYNETSVLSDTKGSTITIVSAVLNGSVTLQGRPTPPDPRWVVPLRVSLTIPGEDTPAYEFTPTTDENGHFTLSGIEPGTYEIRVKNSHTLQNKQTVTLTGGNNSIHFGTLREGDANDDNYVTLIDFSILVSTFAKCEADADYDERADFNSDSCVTLLDFSLLSSNFAQEGQHRPQAPAVTPSGDVSLVIDRPILNPTRVGETFIVTVQVEAQTPVDGASAYIHFDESRLKVNRISAGNTFELEIQNQFDNSDGTIDFAAGTLEELKAGHFDLLQIEFEALASNGESPLEFHFTAPRTTDVTAAGTSVLTGYSDGTGTTVPTAVRASQLAAGQSTGLAWVTLLLLSLLSAGIIRWYVVRRQVAS